MNDVGTLYVFFWCIFCISYVFVSAPRAMRNAISFPYTLYVLMTKYEDLKNLKLKTIDPLGWILFRCFSKMSDSLHFAHFVNGDFNFKWIGSQAGLNGNPATQTYVILGKEVVGAATLSYWCLHSMWSCVFIFICNWRHCYDNDQGPERSRGF